MSLTSDEAALIKERVDVLFRSGRRPHAVLIDGGSEEERTSAARVAAKNIVCTGEGEFSCSQCSSCRKADADVHPDIITVEKSADRKFFQKEALKGVVEGAYLTPNEADTKVYIIKELGFMTEECQNVLLKILEEPPSYTAFVLTAQSANSVIKTVLSRVTRIKLRGDFSGEYSEKATETVRKTLDALLSRFEFDIVSALSPLDGDKALTAEVLSLLTESLGDCVAQKFGREPALSFLKNEEEKLCRAASTERLLKMYDGVSGLLKLCDSYPNYTLLSAALSVRLKPDINL